MKQYWMGLLLLLLSAVPASAAFHAIYLADDMMDPKTASFAFAGFYYDPLPILESGDKNAKVQEEKYFENKDKERLVDFPEMLAKVSKDMKIPCEPAAVTEAQEAVIQKSLLANLTISPKLIAKLAGAHPYVLAAIVDRYGILRGTQQVQVKEKENDKRIEYLGRRSILEVHDAEEFNTGFGRTASLTLVAFSAQDGHVVWQANDSRSIQFVFLNSQKDVAKGCLENIFHKLLDQWKDNQKKKAEIEKKEAALKKK